MQTKTARESIHENVVAEPDLQVRCFSYEDAGVRVPAHWHHSLEILLIDTGSMEVNMNDTRLQLQMGDFVLINSGDIHSTSCSEHARICVLQIPYPFLKSNIPEYDHIRFRTGSCGKEETDRTFRLLLRQLQECGGQNFRLQKQQQPEQRPGLSLHFKSLLYELLYLCISSYQLPESEQNGHFNDTERARLIAVTDYVNAHYTEPVTLQEAAAVVALNPEYFCRFFKKAWGSPSWSSSTRCAFPMSAAIFSTPIRASRRFLPVMALPIISCSAACFMKPMAALRQPNAKRSPADKAGGLFVFDMSVRESVHLYESCPFPSLPKNVSRYRPQIPTKT